MAEAASPGPEIAAILHLFDNQFADVEELLEGLSTEALLWKPFESSPWQGPSAELGLIVAHALSSTVYLVRRAQWAAGRIEWSAVDGDEGNVEFGPANHVPGALLARCRRVQALVHALLPTFDRETLALARPHARRPDVLFTVRGELLHALEHLSRHIGQGMLTRQLWALQAEANSD